ncbi:glycosyltransferase family 4 protein [Rhodococcoides corynebacterioides]|uniref:glycosyltransferase family 4 protein n=1 Tax=Rhodococcoides corynebacterioides TaxID=53972 RepID=UPI001C9B9D5B|nr:glycosyltransferase family 4 protein [Rhodococcus corynebacterioides]MBY6361523.1 glycosyltransferase family 4 protein [Rhodococcus corynebacterioides]
MHDVVPHKGSWWARRSLHEYYRSFDHLVFHSPAAREALSNVTGGPGRRHVVVPHGLYDIFDNDGGGRRDAMDRIGLGSCESPILLMFGNIERRKGIEEVVAAHALLKEQGHEFHVVVAGRNFTGSSSSTAAAIRSAQANPDFTVLAQRIPFDDVKYFFRSADIVLLPYLEGSTSGVFKLALAFGKPVVASRVGDLASEVDDSLGVLLPERWTVADLAGAILEVSQDRQGFAERIASVQRRYDWQTVADRVLALSGMAVDGMSRASGAGDVVK